MTYADMLAMLKKLTLTERLAAVAQALLPEYTTDTALTSFTALDSEDFYEAR